MIASTLLFFLRFSRNLPLAVSHLSARLDLAVTQTVQEYSGSPLSRYRVGLCFPILLLKVEFALWLDFANEMWTEVICELPFFSRGSTWSLGRWGLCFFGFLIEYTGPIPHYYLASPLVWGRNRLCCVKPLRFVNPSPSWPAYWKRAKSFSLQLHMRPSFLPLNTMSSKLALVLFYLRKGPQNRKIKNCNISEFLFLVNYYHLIKHRVKLLSINYLLKF